jgi:hypothetical protein
LTIAGRAIHSRMVPSRGNITATIANKQGMEILQKGFQIFSAAIDRTDQNWLKTRILILHGSVVLKLQNDRYMKVDYVFLNFINCGGFYQQPADDIIHEEDFWSALAQGARMTVEEAYAFAKA